MSDLREILVSGNVFSKAVARAGVPGADQVAATVEDEPRKIPNLMFRALVDLNPEPANRAERSLLLGELYEVWEKCQKFYDAEMEREYARLIEADEAAKEAVRAQIAVVEGLKRKFNENAVELVRLQNLKTMAGSTAQNAVRESQSLNKWASTKQRDEVNRRVAVTQREYEEAQVKAARHHEELNRFQNVTLREADKKLVTLIEAELEISARLEGRDPFIAAHTAITKDSERKVQRFI